MCGIAGLVNLGGRLSPAELAAVAGRMADLMPYRGPDDAGVWVDPGGFCALSHRRLSIIDTSPAGHQPMVSPDGRHAIAFNGELYNFQELRRDAEARGETFTSHSDTEVFLAGLRHEGAYFLTRVDAMFAIAWYDSARQELLLARDPFGEKPLYYTEQNGLFAFASELHALTALPGFDPAISHGAISSYLAFQKVPAPATLYDHCLKLAPGQYLRIGRQGPAPATRYHHFICVGERQGCVPLEEQADQLEELLLTSLRRRLISDVPLGAFLSGGMDSSTAVALISRKLNRSMQTFSIGFSGIAESEHIDARAMAEHIGTDHRDEMIAPESYADLADIAMRMDEPNADSSCVPTHAISALARRHVTVAITGDGGDEMFGGYGRYLHCLAAATEHEAEMANRRWHLGRDYFSNRRFMVFADDLLGRIFGSVPALTADILLDWRRRLDLDTRPIIDRLREADMAVYLPVVLAKVDRMSMLNSLECRTPYLSVDVARFAAGLAPDRLIQGQSTKRVLRTLAERYLPRELLDKPKRGFGVDPRNTIAQQAVADRLARLLGEDDARLRQWFTAPTIARLLGELLPNTGFYTLWSFLVLELWLRSHPHRASGNAI